MLTISSGHSADYLTGAVATGRENYYTGAVAAGEPPGRWYGAGAEALGLTGEVDHQDMSALYEHFVDPRDERFRDPTAWAEADKLGHTGRKYLTEDEIYAAALEAEPDASPERREDLRVEAGTKARRNVSFLDATFSVQKSITVLHAAFEREEVAARHDREAAEAAHAAALAAGDRAGAQVWAARAGDAGTTEAAWAAHRQAVEDAIWAGNRAALDYLQRHAGYSRVGHHGGVVGRYIDAHDWTVASFFQHDSRDHDPQLHIHNAILNRVQGADGQWRTLDGRSLYAYRGAASAVAERTTEEHLTRALGVRFAARPDGKAREVLGVAPEVMELFSSRRRAITRHTGKLLAAFEAKFGRPANSLERDRLQRQATFATRSAKSHEGESVEARLERWDAELRAEVSGGLAGVAHDVLDLAGQAPEPERWSPTAVIETALAAVQQSRAAWTASDLTRAISDALPDHLGGLSGDQVTALLDGLTAEALALAVPLDAERPADAVLPDELRLADGRSAYDHPGGRLYATPEHIHTERLLQASAARGGAPALTPEVAATFVASLAEAGVELGADQAAAVRGVLTSGAAVETLVGPAGTGKSFTVGALAKAWTDPALWGGQARQVVGLAASQVATDVLAGEGLRARNITRWLAAQQRLTAADTHGAPTHFEDQQWRVRPGDLIVVDESAMANTAALAQIQAHVTAGGGKLLLVGDHRQLAAVGAAGGMALTADAGPSYELAEARRFTHAWERDASLRLREADGTVLGEYHRHGRLLDSGTVEQAEASAARAWLADTLAGRRSVLIVDTNEQAARVSAQLRAELVRLGRVTETGVPLGLQGTFAGVGDLVQARKNGWHLTGVHGNRRAPINRETYRVTDTLPDGGLIVASLDNPGERITLPASYVAEHVALGYASTVHAAQGITVDTSHTVVTTTTGADALYVGMSRGRASNTAHVTTRSVPADAPTGEVPQALHRDPVSVLTATLEAADPQRSALATAVESAAEARSVRTPAELLADAAELATAGRTARWFDQLAADGHLTPAQRVALAAEDGATTLTRLLRRAELAGHDPRHVLTDAVTSRPLDGARQITNVIHHRITATVAIDPIGDTYAEWVPAVDDPQWRTYLAGLAADADARRTELGLAAAANPPQWAVEAFGPVPDETDTDMRRAWTVKAGIVAAHRELTGHDDPATALGRAPKPGQVEEYASWRAAWRALGRPDADRDELELSDGQLRVRVRAAEREQTWAPPYVAQELAGTRQAAVTHRATATLRQAEADAVADPHERERLEREAAEAAALADVLDALAADLVAADAARAEWLAHTAATRAAAQRAAAELAARDLDKHAEPEVTAAEWLAAHHDAERAEEPHRVVTDVHELADVADAREADAHAVDLTTGRDPADEVTAGEADIRQATADEPPPVERDTVQVATAEDTADAVRRAQRALVEMQQRRAAEEQHAIEEARAEQLTRWHTDDQTREAEAKAERDLADDDTATVALGRAGR